MNNKMMIIDEAQGFVDKIYKHMRSMETCEAIAEKISNLPFVFVDKHETKDIVIGLDGVLTDEQIALVRTTVLELINSNKAEAQTFLNALSKFEVKEEAKPVNVHKNLDDAYEATIAEVKKPEPVKTESVILDYDAVKKLYTETDRSLEDVGKELGVSRSSLHKFVVNNNLKKPSKR